MTRVQVLYWQEIPSLVRATAADGTQVSRQLPDWFQQEIDRVAMEQGLVGSDAYLEQWQWGEPEERDGAVNDVLDAVEAELGRSAVESSEQEARDRLTADVADRPRLHRMPGAVHDDEPPFGASASSLRAHSSGVERSWSPFTRSVGISSFAPRGGSAVGGVGDHGRHWRMKPLPSAVARSKG